ncbi:MAG TPA: DUF4126 domain-containing protein [Burkholderiales bacterium]|nr:DUF4126 domain-containing protein [Burkholderiales bacterium]
MDTLQTVALATGLSWASGIRLYAVLFVVGLGNALGWVTLPHDLQVLSHPLVLSVSGLMLLLEFCADKMPGFDSMWDALHTFVRVPAGALLALGAIGHENTPQAVAAALLGGALATGTHLTKAGSRALINTSPEPFSNWAASFSEDALVLAILWAAFAHPWLLFVLLAAFSLLMYWLLPRIVGGIAAVLRRIGEFLGGSPHAPAK